MDRSHMTMKRSLRLFLPTACLCVLVAACCLRAFAQNTQQLGFAGLRALAGKGQFNSALSDGAGHLYLLLDEKDGVRILKTDANATQVLAEVQMGAQSDIGLAMALDPTGNVYVTGTTASGSLPTTSGVSFPSPADSSTNSFVAKLDPQLHPIFVTYSGSGRMAAAAIAATADRVCITGGIYAATLPVTPSAIVQRPAAGSSGNGFVECFRGDGSALVYATYLSGLNGDTNPAAIAADAGDNVYVAGYTSSTGYPTVAAVVPEMIGTGSGFLTKLTPAGDGIVFSTFVPGLGVTSLALDGATQTLLFSGTIAAGGFPIAAVAAPMISADYQSVVRMTLDGTSVLGSTLLGPGSQSVVTPAPNGAVWAALPLSVPLLPLTAISDSGSSVGLRVTAQNTIDESVRFGGPGAEFSSMPVNVTSIAVDENGQPVFAGSAQPTTSSVLLATQTYDLPLINAPTTALPSTLRDAALAPGANCGSLCAGSGAYLTKLNLVAGAALALSTDASPNIVLRNLGSLTAMNLAISATGFTVTHDCPTQLGAGAECDLVLVGAGPGTLTVQAANATAQTVNLATTSRAPATLLYSPREVDFGVVTAVDAAVTRTVTVTNMGTAAETAPLPVSFAVTANVTIAESGDCPGQPSAQPLQPGASCHLVLSASAIPGAASAAFQSTWSSGASSLTVTGYTQGAALNLSASEIEFGTQFVGGLRLPRYLYLSNHSSSPAQHAPVALQPSSPFTVTDRCPTVLEPHTVCQIQIDYQSPRTSADSATLSLDQGTSVLLTGKTIPQPGAGGDSANPNLVVAPAAVDFPNAVIVTGVSAGTQTVTVTNTGAQPFPLSLALAGDFTQSTDCGATLVGGASCSVLLSFTPSQPGARQGLLSVSSGVSTTPAYVNLSGTGTPILASNQGAIDLGSTPIGQPVVLWTKITQSLSQLTATTSGDFRVILVEDIGYGHGQPAGSAFAPVATGSCFNCWLGVEFLPAAAGAKSAQLALASSSGMPYDLMLTGNGLPLTGLLLTPVQQDFGPIAVHSSSASSLFTLTNLTSDAVNLTAPVVTGDFVVRNAVTGGPACVGVLAVNASCFVQVGFAPTVTGPASGTLTLTSDHGTATAALTGFGSPDTGVSLNPSALVFRNVPDTAATEQTITLTDTGIYNLAIGTPVSNSTSFNAATTCGTLLPGGTCTITVNFIPANATVEAALSIPVTGSAAGAPQTTVTVPLSGTYTAEDTGLQILPGQADYGPTATGTLGLTRQFLVNNLSAKTVTLSLSVPRQFTLTQPPCTTLAPGAGCSFSLGFLPLTNGDVTGTVFAQATPTDGGATQNSLGYVEGFGRGSGVLAITGDLLPGRIADFHQVASGQSATRSLTITNTGSGAMTVRRITSEWPFLSSTTCGQTLQAGESCTVTLTYAPINQIAAGSSSAPFNTDGGTLVIESDAVSSPDFVNLTGTVTPMTVAAPSNTAPLRAYTVSQSSLTFAATAGGNVSAAQTVTLSNTGTATIHVSGTTTTPDFTVSGSCATLVPGASCPLTVTFTPQASSSQTLTQVASALEITSDASSSLDFISLFGTAMPPTLSLSPVLLDFGSVLVGGSSTLPIQVTNGSYSPAVFHGITSSGDYGVAGDCPAAGAPLASSASCTLQVTFKPTQSGTRTGTVSVATSLTTLALTANLTGVGMQSHLQVTPSSVSFGSAVLGTSTSLTVSLMNTGTALVSQLAFVTTGDYTVTKPCGVTALAPGVGCTLTVSFAPSAIGERSGKLTITSSDASSPLTLPLTGEGTPAGAFTLTVDGGTASTVKVVSGKPASYHLALTSQYGYKGAVILNCTPIHAGQYAACSLLPSSLNVVDGSVQASVATLNTVTETTTSQMQRSDSGGLAVCLLPLGLLFFRRGRGAVAIVLLSMGTLFASGCGSGGKVIFGDPSLRYTPAGNYQYQVTATSSTGTPLSQAVILNLTVTAQ